MFLSEARVQTVAGVKISFSIAHSLYSRPKTLADGWHHLRDYVGGSGSPQDRSTVGFQALIVGMNVAVNEYWRRLGRHCLQLP